MNPLQPSIAVVGLGQMGSRMAARLIAQGHRVTVSNRSVERTLPLQALGARVAATPAAAVADAEMVITSLRGQDAELATVTELAGAMRPGALHICTSTVSPAMAEVLEERHQDSGTRFLASPVQGRPEAAEQGQLLAWTSGARAHYEQARPVLEQLASSVVWLGESPQQGPAAKLTVNMLMFANIELLAEAYDYLGRCGIDPALVGQGLTKTVFATPLFKAIVGGLAGDHAAEGTNLRGSLVDLDMLVADGDRLKALLPVARVVRNRFAMAAALGHGDKSQTAVALLFD